MIMYMYIGAHLSVCDQRRAFLNGISHVNPTLIEKSVILCVSR